MFFSFDYVIKEKVNFAAVQPWSYGCTWEVCSALKKLESHSAIVSCDSYAFFGQHSLTSVERPSHLWSDFVKYDIILTSWFIFTPCMLLPRFDRPVHSGLSDDMMFVSRSCLAFSIFPRLIHPQKMPLYPFEKDVLMFRPFTLALAHHEGPFSRCY